MESSRYQAEGDQRKGHVFTEKECGLYQDVRGKKCKVLAVLRQRER